MDFGRNYLFSHIKYIVKYIEKYEPLKQSSNWYLTPKKVRKISHFAMEKHLVSIELMHKFCVTFNAYFKISVVANMNKFWLFYFLIIFSSLLKWLRQYWRSFFVIESRMIKNKSESTWNTQLHSVTLKRKSR